MRGSPCTMCDYPSSGRFWRAMSSPYKSLKGSKYLARGRRKKALQAQRGLAGAAKHRAPTTLSTESHSRIIRHLDLSGLPWVLRVLAGNFRPQHFPPHELHHSTCFKRLPLLRRFFRLISLTGVPGSTRGVPTREPQETCTVGSPNPRLQDQCFRWRHLGATIAFT